MSHFGVYDLSFGVGRGLSTQSADGAAESPPVKIPITVKHHIAPPEEPDDLAAASGNPDLPEHNNDLLLVNNGDGSTVWDEGDGGGLNGGTHLAEGGEDATFFPEVEIHFCSTIEKPAPQGAEDAFFVVNAAETTSNGRGGIQQSVEPLPMSGSGAETTPAADPYRKFNFSVDLPDAADDDDHAIIFDPDGDLKPPVEPVGASGSDTASDGRQQGTYDIGGYVPSTIVAGADDLATTAPADADSFDFVAAEPDLEAPVPPGEIIIMPEPVAPPDNAPHGPTLGWGVGGIESGDGALDGDGAVIFIADSVDMLI